MARAGRPFTARIARMPRRRLDWTYDDEKQPFTTPTGRTITGHEAVAPLRPAVVCRPSLAPESPSLRRSVHPLPARGGADPRHDEMPPSLLIGLRSLTSSHSGLHLPPVLLGNLMHRRSEADHAHKKQGRGDRGKRQPRQQHAPKDLCHVPMPFGSWGEDTARKSELAENARYSLRS